MTSLVEEKILKRTKPIREETPDEAAKRIQHRWYRHSACKKAKSNFFLFHI